GQANDRLFGDAGNDIIKGDGGNDSLFGGNGADTLIGGANRDFLSGDSGNDTLIGGQGGDDLKGGAGADVFVFASGSGQDKILDFNPGEDSITLQGLGFQTVAEVIDNSFDVRGNLILFLDADGSDFSWSTSNYVDLIGIDKTDLHDGNIALIS
ncbi:MAG TPA: calcium-binding protein, partial [Rhizobiales bacterium]|nr:calcium-binding protein [Hyphomicrobiales bacterium]